MNKEWSACLIWGGGSLAATLIATVAHKLGYIDRDTVIRMVFGVNGLLFAWYGNQMPKAMVPRTQPATRVAAWSLVLSGIVHATLWAFAPIPMAVIGGCGAVLLGIGVTLIYSLLLRIKAKTT